MPTSILGKRTRRSTERAGTCQSLLPPLLKNELIVEAGATELPPTRKRRTCSAAVEIFEDAQETLSRDKDVSNNAVGNACTQQSRVDKENVSTKDVTNSGSDENCPPADMTFMTFRTPTSRRFKDAIGTGWHTPKHQVRFTSGLITPSTGRSVKVKKPRAHSTFAKARLLFSTSTTPSRLTNRDTERQQLHQFIANASESKKGGCLYLSGPPGTGKSALVHEVLQHFQASSVIRVSIINCVSLKTSTEVYGKLIADLAPDAKQGTLSAKALLQKVLTSKQKKKTIHLVMLDEIDSLVDADCEILYNIFEWSMHESSSLALIGVANALDLTDRFLPRLKAKNLKPQILPFLPYTHQQISSIITEKLRSLLPDATTDKNFVPFMHPAAISLCGKKIASQTGDIRKAFALVRQSIDYIEKEAIAKLEASAKQPLSESANMGSASPATHIEYTPETAPRATIAHVARLATSIFNNGTVSRLGGLNLQQKAVLCSLVASERRREARDPFTTPSKSTNKLPRIADLFDKYTALCQRDEGILQPLKSTEFRDVVSSLETLGLVHESKRSLGLLTPTSSSSRYGKHSEARLLVSGVSEKEMRGSLSGPGGDLLRRLLDE